MGVTQKTIAGILGLDRSTVSKALSGDPGIPERLRLRVRALCDDMGYQPHLGAVSLSSRHTRTLSVVGGLQVVEGVQGLWILLLQEAAQLRGYRCRCDSWERVPSVIAETSTDGFVIFGSPPLDLSDAPPIVYTDCGELEHPLNAVTTGNADAAASVVGHLADLGHRRVVYFGLVANSGVSLDRLRGFRREGTRRGLSLHPEFIITEADWPTQIEDSFQYRDQLLAAVGAGATAVVTTSDVAAVSTMRMLREAGLSVPADVSVATWDDTLVTRAVQPTLTTVRQNFRVAAEEAIGMLVGLVESRTECAKSLVVPSELVVRESTAPPRV